MQALSYLYQVPASCYVILLCVVVFCICFLSLDGTMTFYDLQITWFMTVAKTCLRIFLTYGLVSFLPYLQFKIYDQETTLLYRL